MAWNFQIINKAIISTLLKIFVFIFLLVNCNCSKVEKLDFSNQIIKLNFVAKPKNLFTLKISKVIPLETSDSILIGRITKLIYYKNCVYVFDMMHSRAINCFSENGTLKFKINIGKGPNEVIQPTDFTIFNDTLFVKDMTVVKSFSFMDGKYYSTREIPLELFFDNFIKVDSISFLTFGNSPPLSAFKNSNYNGPNDVKDSLKLYKVYDNNFTNEKLSFENGNFNFIQLRIHQPICKFSDHYLLLSPPNSTINQYVNNKIERKYSIDFGDYTFSQKELNKSIDSYINLIETKKRIGFIDYVNETNNLITFAFIKTRGINDFCIYSKKSNKAVVFGNELDYNGLPSMSILSTFHDELICVINPSIFSDNDIIELRKKLSLNNNFNNMSNPLIIFIKINEKVN